MVRPSPRYHAQGNSTEREEDHEGETREDAVCGAGARGAVVAIILSTITTSIIAVAAGAGIGRVGALGCSAVAPAVAWKAAELCTGRGGERGGW